MTVDYRVLIGDCLETLKTLPEQSVHTCVTSPPYFGLRDYGVEGQLGAEPTPDEFVEALVRVFREVWRVLRDDGTVWLNLGDSYAGSMGGSFKSDSAWEANIERSQDKGFLPGVRARTPYQRSRMRVEGCKPKDLIGVPWMVAFALRSDGWFLRQEIIWDKPNALPEAVKDRPARGHETWFLLSKSRHYAYDNDAVKEPSEHNSTGLRNRRSVWRIPKRNYKGAHFATFPPDLIQPCILAGCPEGGTVLDPFGGSGTTAGVALAHGRNAILCELNPEYARLVPERIDWITDYYKAPRVEHPRQEAPTEIDDFDLDLDGFDLDMDLAI